MLTVYSVVAVIFVALAAFVAGDDTEGLRFALNALCDVNKEGAFAQCCADHPASSVVIDDKDTWSCYMNDLAVQDSAIVSLNFASKGLTDLGVGAFSKLTNLASLEVGYGNIATVKKGAFDGLNNLYSLDLMKNNLQEIEAGVFDNLENLWLVHLFTNSLKSLPEGIFDRLTKLEILDFDYNSITSLPVGLFDKLSALTAMDISANPLFSLAPGAFASLTKLTVLLAHDNYYSELPENVFPKDSQLYWLDLHSNNFSSFPAKTFNDLTMLKVLNLNSNILTSLPEDLFSKNLELTDLTLDENELTSLPEGIFDDLTKLKFLNLNKNSLTYINMGNITPETFFISSNNLVVYREEDTALDELSSRIALEVSNNCLIDPLIPIALFNIPFGHVLSGDQSRCPKNICNVELRASGCFECDGDNCISCLDGYILYDGKCVACFDSDDCPFGNKNQVECINEFDLSHCSISNPVYCSEHVCVDDVCLHGDFGDGKDCAIGGMGCKGCKCMKGWYPKEQKDKDCETHCGDGIVVDTEECDMTLGCDNKTCKCADGYKFVQHGSRKKCVLENPVSSSSSSSSSNSASSSSGKSSSSSSNSASSSSGKSSSSSSNSASSSSGKSSSSSSNSGSSSSGKSSSSSSNSASSSSGKSSSSSSKSGSSSSGKSSSSSSKSGSSSSGKSSSSSSSKKSSSSSGKGSSSSSSRKSSSSSSSSNSEKKSSRLSGGAIAGISVGVIAVAVVGGFLAIFLLRRKISRSGYEEIAQREN